MKDTETVLDLNHLIKSMKAEIHVLNNVYLSSNTSSPKKERKKKQWQQLPSLIKIKSRLFSRCWPTIRNLLTICGNVGKNCVGSTFFSIYPPFFFLLFLLVYPLLKYLFTYSSTLWEHFGALKQLSIPARIMWTVRLIS